MSEPYVAKRGIAPRRAVPARTPFYRRTLVKVVASVTAVACLGGVGAWMLNDTPEEAWIPVETSDNQVVEAARLSLTKSANEVPTDPAVLEAINERRTALNLTSNDISAENARLKEANKFFWPTTGTIGSPWGMRMHPILHYTRMHAGVDIGGACGQPIWATHAGVVTAVGYNGGAGNEVKIDHGNVGGTNFTTTYMHMSKTQVTVGQKVLRGQQIGLVGNTGLSTSCHLHFEVYANGQNVNPATYLNK